MERNIEPEELLLRDVQKMRSEQKEFFRTKRMEHLKNSKELERDIDNRIDEYFSPQKELFNVT